jgi:hypothetical protein
MLEAPDRISVEMMHEFAVWVADWYQQKSHERYKINGQLEDIVHAALTSIIHDAITAHRAVGLLVWSGWSSAAAPTVRMILDLTVSMLAVINSENPRLAAFRYFHAGYRNFERDLHYTKGTRRHTRELLRQRVAQLDPVDRPAALKYLRSKERAYWFADEWSSPSKIVDEFGSEHMRWEYQQYSAAAHGGFFALRTVRDRPFDADINARLPIGRSAAVVSLESARALIELVCLRDQWENSGFSIGICPELRELFSRVVLPNDVPHRTEQV